MRLKKGTGVSIPVISWDSKGQKVVFDKLYRSCGGVVDVGNVVQKFSDILIIDLLEAFI